MERLFQLLYNYRAFILFLLLEYVSFVLIKNRTIYQQTQIVKTANEFSGIIKDKRAQVSDYLLLTEINEDLREENARLRDLLSKNTSAGMKSIRGDRPPEVLQQYYFVPAEVINNSTTQFNNYITINKGAIHGIKPDMAVIGSKGVVGKIESVSSNFSTIVSVLHSGYYLSSKILPNEIQCTLKWDAQNSQSSNLLYVPRHLNVSIGDTAVSSGFNAIFPEGVGIGVIKNVELSEDATFYDIKVQLFTNFNALKNVYVVGNRLRDEKLELEAQSTSDNE